jgi:hypothetical protein
LLSPGFTSAGSKSAGNEPLVGFWPGDSAEAYIGDEALYFHGRYETWSLPGNRLRSIAFLPGDPDIPDERALLAFNLATINLSGWRGQALFIPVPAGHEAEARRLSAIHQECNAAPA